MKISASIVLYNTNFEDLHDSIQTFRFSTHSNLNKRLILIDNSSTNILKNVIKTEDILYIHNPKNTGFGDAHNIAIREAQRWGSDYHFVINPDVKANSDVIAPMIEYMEKHQNIGMMMPKILNFDGSEQNLPKLLPSPYSIFMRKLKKPEFIYKDFIKKYELRDVPKDMIYEAPILSGCFTLFRMKALQEIGLYDEKFFMYFEDWDISRRMNQKYKTVYFPKVAIYHGYESGANKSSRLFKIFVESAITYFNKWGWIMDSDRHEINTKTLEQFK